MHTDFGLLGNLATSLVVATLLGVFSTRIKLSPIVGYLVAGIILGPQTPGFVADTSTATELAEIGVVLLMFGVGLHFNLEDLLAVRWVAFPGAVAQFVVATSIVLGCVWLSGLPIVSGLVLGVAVSIASTVVVTRVLMDSDQLNSPSGHVAVGWLIAQDIFTVLVIVAMPAVGELWSESSEAKPSFIWSLAWALMQVIVLCSIVLVFGKFSIPWILRQVARTRSRELFTLTILSLAIAIAVGSSAFFGVSMALGAFLGGMVVGQTEASHQAAADALPMRDAFAVLFFVSVGMQFDQRVFVHSPGLLLTVLLIVMVVNPLTAFTVAWWARYSVSTSISVAILLSQIGEFSFLLADLAVDQKLLSDELRSVLVASSIISIALNPIIFRLGRPLEMQLRKRQSLWRALSRRSEREGALANSSTHDHLEAVAAGPHGPGAVIVGYGPVGQTAYRLLFECGIRPVVVDLNLDTIRELKSQGIDAIYGDAGNADILEAANIRDAKYLLVTIPEMLTRSLIILTAKNLNPELQIFVRARYIRERIWLEEVGANRVITEEGETAVSLAVRLLEEMGAEKDQIRKETRRIQSELGLNGEN
ncbi:MAG: cation:proton antiporter [Pirellulales bacterium]